MTLLDKSFDTLAIEFIKYFYSIKLEHTSIKYELFIGKINFI